MTDTKANAEPPGSFVRDDDGAVTVDWVVLAAAVVLLAIPVSSLVGAAVESAESGIADRVVDTTND